jgi:hypothetical protein
MDWIKPKQNLWLMIGTKGNINCCLLMTLWKLSILLGIMNLMYMNEVASEELIFSGREDNEGNSEMLKPYGLRLINDGSLRRLQNIETGEIYTAEWER